MVAQVLSVDERLTTLRAHEPSLPVVRSTHVSLHIEVPSERLAADWTHDAAGMLTPVVCAFPGRFDLLAAQPALVHVPVNMQPVMFVEVPATDEPATADFALKWPITSVGSAVNCE